MPDGKAEPGLLDRSDRGDLVVYGQRDDLDACFGKLFARALKPRELGLTIRAPRASVDQDNTIRAKEGLRSADNAAANRGDIECRKGLAISQAHRSELHRLDCAVQVTWIDWTVKSSCCIVFA